MIVIVLYILVNSFICTLYFQFILYLTKTSLPFWYSYWLAFIILGGVSILSYSKFGSSIVLFKQQIRKLSHNDCTRVNYCLENAIEIVNNNYHTNHNTNNFVVNLSHKPDLIKSTIGKNVILFGQNTFNILDNNELKILILWSIVDLHFKHGIQANAMMLNEWIFKNIISGLNIVILAKKYLPKMNATLNKFASGLLIIGYIVILTILLPILIINWLGLKIAKILKAFYYRASHLSTDKHIVNLGFGANLVTLLEKISYQDVSFNNSHFENWLYNLYSPICRINKVEKIIARMDI